MGSQITFYEKNMMDLENESASVTASQGADFAKFVRSRSLKSAWVTTGSVDADNTTFDFDLGSSFNIDTMILVDHNFKSYKIELYDAGTGLYSTLKYDTTNDSQETSLISLAEFYGQKFRITVRGTQVANSDKKLNRLIVTKKLGQFSYWPKISGNTIAQGKVIRQVLSGKSAILRTVGAFKCKLSIANWRNAADLELIEKLYRQPQGFEVWFSGGDEDQFFYAVEGFRKKDIYLMGFANDWKPQLVGGIYTNGADVELDLVEVVS